LSKPDYKKNVPARLLQLDRAAAGAANSVVIFVIGKTIEVQFVYQILNA